ncbi:MAG: hypothetical protein IT267_08185 [Saprospiraceae bacterium]|nr:hypothetical protein [Saprospiraceae bacterium]
MKNTNLLKLKTYLFHKIILLSVFSIYISCNKPLSQAECHQGLFKVSIAWNEQEGTLTANNTNGAPPFMYNWSNGNTNFKTINVHNIGGTYSV